MLACSENEQNNIQKENKAKVKKQRKWHKEKQEMLVTLHIL